MLTEKQLIEMRDEAHADYLAEEAREATCMTGGRSLYKVWAGTEVVAFIATYNRDRVMGRYLANGGQKPVTQIERISYGYPKDTCEVYA